MSRLSSEIEVICPCCQATLVIDVHLGRVISPLLVRGQLQGGVVQGWGQAFCEEEVYDEQGQLLSGSFTDYAMPRLGCMPSIRNETIQVDTQLNLLGSKGVGESGCTG